MVVAVRVVSNSMVVSEATVEDKLAVSLAGNVGDKWVIDSDCWLITVAGNVAETFAGMPLRYLEARIFDMAIDTAAARVPEDRQTVVARKTDRLGTTDGFAVMEWVVIARCISVESRSRDCYRGCSQPTVRPDKIPHLLSVRLELLRADTVGNGPHVAPVEIPERN